MLYNVLVVSSMLLLLMLLQLHCSKTVTSRSHVHTHASCGSRSNKFSSRVHHCLLLLRDGFVFYDCGVNEEMV
jgi:hypothetical protein